MDYVFGDKRSKEALDFLKAYEDLCKEHGLCLSHEDSGGAFQVEPLSDLLLDWVKATACELRDE